MAHSEGMELDLQDTIERSCTSKTRYRSPGAAGAAARTAKIQRGVNDLRVYSCPYCGGYHLTKLALETLIDRY